MTTLAKWLKGLSIGIIAILGLGLVALLNEGTLESSTLFYCGVVVAQCWMTLVYISKK